MADESRIDLGITGLGPAIRIGSGGFADVYRARQTHLNREVAVKILRAAAGDAQARMRFERECHAVGAVSGHPNIVGVHEGGFTPDGRAYLIMELCRDGSLSDRLSRTGPLGPDEVIDIGSKIARALGVAHQTGVVHRDVKPGNILVSTWGEPALADFGIARVEGAQQTASGQVTASLAHAAPEVLEGESPSPSSDLYSLGSTLYHLFTGHPPHVRPDDESVLALMRRVLTEPIPDPAAIGMPEPLASVVRRATARQPTERFETGAAMAAALMAQPGSVNVFAYFGAAPEPNSEPTVLADADTWDAPAGEFGHPVPPAAVPGSAQAGMAPTPAALVGSMTTPMASAPVISDRVISDPVASPTEIVAPAPARSRRWPLVAAVLVLVLAVSGGGAAAWLARGSTPVPPVDLVFTQGEIGPLDRNQSYVLSATGGGQGVSYQLLVDDTPVGPVSSNLTTFTPTEAGRHRVSVQTVPAAGSGAEPMTSVPVEIFVIGPLPPAGYRANLASVRVGQDNWPTVIDRYDELVANGHTNLEILPSDRLSGRNPGWWNLFVPGFGEDSAAAQAYCDSYGLTSRNDCFPSRFDPSAVPATAVSTQG